MNRDEIIKKILFLNDQLVIVRDKKKTKEIREEIRSLMKMITVYDEK